MYCNIEKFSHFIACTVCQVCFTSHKVTRLNNLSTVIVRWRY